jgi:asparagine synthase (glutamine-hydrolysing)
MSRITGILSYNNESITSSVDEMLNLFGKADEGWERSITSSDEACFGWTGWSRPSIYKSDKIMVVMDGYIYNRSEFGEDSDAPLFAQLYERYGFTEAIRKINGDFAVALFDERKRMLFLARDRFGVKPLYYYSDPLRFAFASQPGALLKISDSDLKLNREFVALFAASHYRYFDNKPDRSPYEGVFQLPASSILTVKDGVVESSVYWTLSNLSDLGEKEDELAEEYRALLVDAVKLRVNSAKRPAFTLSGGMDSSSVLASAVHQTGRKQHAYSSVYSDKTYDESEEIRSMLDSTVSRWHPVNIGSPDVFDVVKKMVAAHHEPVATATWLSHFVLCEEASRDEFSALFGGLGGDELNAGEYEHFIYHFADLRAEGAEGDLKNEVEFWIKYHDHPIFRKNFSVVEDAFKRLVDLGSPGRCIPDRTRIERYTNLLNKEFFDLEDFEPEVENPFKSYLKNRTYQDLTRETIPCCLRAEDRQTVYFGLDNFVPFFDHRLVEFMFNVSGRLKFRDGVSKYLLRKAMKGILPEETRTRIKKTGWNAPAHVWFSSRSRQDLMDLVHSQKFKNRGIYNIGEVYRIIDEHNEIISTGRIADNHMMLLWQLVNLELWIQWTEDQFKR